MKSETEREAEARAEAERLERDLNAERRWEYHVVRMGPKARPEEQLNLLGAKGWQLVQVTETDGYLSFFMERELPPPDDASNGSASES